METFNLIRYLTVERNKGIIIWLLNIGAEKYWNPVTAGIVDRNEDRIVNRVEEMNLFICREQDILILRESPDEVYLRMLNSMQISIPRIWVPEHADPLTPISELVLKDENLLEELAGIARDSEEVYFVPYAVTHLEEQIAQHCGLCIPAAPSAVNAMVNDKIFNREIAEKLGLEVAKGKICSNAEEISLEYDRLVNQTPYFEKIIIKEPYGASGKGLFIIDSEAKLKSVLTRIGRLSRSNPSSRWLVEGWYRKKADINYQIYISPVGEVNVFSIKKQILKDTVYIGSKLPAELSEERIQAYREYGERIGRHLFEIGYTGVAGIDSIVTHDDRIIPIIEINGRFTLSTYISFLENFLHEERKVFSRYFKLMSDSPMGYNDLCFELYREGMLYEAGSGVGVFVYTSGTLPLTRDEDSGLYFGRLFTLIIGKDWDQVTEYNLRLEAFLDHIFHLGKTG